MTTINLRDFFPWYTSDEYVEVTDEMAMELRADRRYEPTHQRRMRRNKSQYSLDCNDGIENSALRSEPSAQEILERQEEYEMLCQALNSLPETQGRRVDACILCGKKAVDVAKVEGVDSSAVSQCIQRGLRNMKKYLKKSM